MKVGVLVRMSERERDMLKRAAAAQNLSVSQFIRHTMLKAAMPWNGSRRATPRPTGNGILERKDG